MSYADEVFIRNCRDILENGVWDTDRTVRPHWEDDGAPAHTVKKFGIVNRYDLSEEFPLLTLRRTYWKTAVDELRTCAPWVQTAVTSYPYLTSRFRTLFPSSIFGNTTIMPFILPHPFCYHIKFIIIFVAKICKKYTFSTVNKEKDDKFNTYYIY